MIAGITFGELVWVILIGWLWLGVIALIAYAAVWLVDQQRGR